MILATVRDYARDHLSDAVLRDLDEKDECPTDLVRAMCGESLGLQLLFIDERYGGMGGGALDVYRVCEQMARIDLGIATSVLATFLGSDPIVFGGTEEQKQRWLGRIARDGALMAYGATEPEAGSDLGALRTVARRVERDGEVVGYRITGRKQWISNGGVADLYTILAGTPGGPSWFVVDAGTPGFAHGGPENKHGIRASNTAALMLDDVEVDADRLVGSVEGQGLLQAQRVFGFTRLMVAAFGLGAGWAALDRAIPYSQSRVQAGSPLSEKRGYTHKLIVPHVVRLEVARAAIEETANRIDAGEGDLNTEGAVAKYLASEAGNLAADAALQAHGGYGYTHDFFVEKIRRDVRITTIYEGTSEIMEMTIGRDRWQLHLKTGGAHYRDLARRLEELGAAVPGVGAEVAAIALRALAAVMERCRRSRLTRHQHVLFRLGALIAGGEGAAAMARRAAQAAEGGLGDKADRRFSPATLALISRIAAREAALSIGEEGLRWVVAGDPTAASGLDEFARELGLPAILRAQEGLLGDMDELTAAVYGRTESAVEPPALTAAGALRGP